MEARKRRNGHNALARALLSEQIQEAGLHRVRREVPLKVNSSLRLPSCEASCSPRALLSAKGVTIESLNFGEASSHLGNALGLLGRAAERLKTLGWDDARRHAGRQGDALRLVFRASAPVVIQV